MKDFLMELMGTQQGTDAKRNAMREYLQAYILRILHEKGLFRTAAFVGGTALRFLHQLPRYSEDLDFSLVKGTGDNFLELMKAVKTELHLAGYDVSITYKESRVVQYAFVKFARLLQETGLSPHENQVFSIKVEIDSNPPKGAALETILTNKFFPLALLSHDKPSLFSGKIHALLSRRYTKGRDYFDLGWYLSKWPDLSPNISFLINALQQTKWGAPFPSENNWKEFLRDVLEKADWKKVKQDVTPFLERALDLQMVTKENILSLLQLH